MDVPQALITAYRQAFIEGLHQAFPEGALREHFKTTLTRPPFADENQYFPYDLGHIAVNQLPRILQDQPPTAADSLQRSLEHDIRRYMRPEDSVLDRRSDRKSLTNHDLLCTYRLFQQAPEIFAGFYLWQHTLRTYAQELSGLIYGRFYQTHDIRGMTGDEVQDKLLSVFPLQHAVTFTRNNIEVMTVPLFFTAATLAQAQNRQGERLAAPRADDFIDGAANAFKAGIFRRRFDTPFGERRVMCPFAPFGVDWLALDLGENGVPEDAALLQCIRTIAENRGNPKVGALCNDIQQSMGDLLAASDQDEITRLEQDIADMKQPVTTELEACPVHSGNQGALPACPIHI